MVAVANNKISNNFDSPQACRGHNTLTPKGNKVDDLVTEGICQAICGLVSNHLEHH